MCLILEIKTGQYGISCEFSFENKDGILMIEMEYADGGNLAEFLVKQTVRMEEKDILGFRPILTPKLLSSF